MLSEWINSNELPWTSAAERQWAEKAWAALCAARRTRDACTEEDLGAAYLVGLALLFDDFRMLAWQEHRSDPSPDWVAHVPVNRLGIALTAGVRRLVDESERCGQVDEDELFGRCLSAVAFDLRDEIAEALLWGFQGEDRLFAAFSLLDAYRKDEPNPERSEKQTIADWEETKQIVQSWNHDVGFSDYSDRMYIVAHWIVNGCPNTDRGMIG